jgi:hypothetical protein
MDSSGTVLGSQDVGKDTKFSAGVTSAGTYYVAVDAYNASAYTTYRSDRCCDLYFTLMATELLACLMGCVMAKRVELLFLASGLTTGGQSSFFGLICSIKYFIETR